MTFDTTPFCGQCGWEVGDIKPDLGADLICDSCGADLTLYGFTNVPPIPPPVGGHFRTEEFDATFISTPLTPDLLLTDGFDISIDAAYVNWDGGSTVQFQSSTNNDGYGMLGIASNAQMGAVFFDVDTVSRQGRLPLGVAFVADSRHVVRTVLDLPNTVATIYRDGDGGTDSPAFTASTAIMTPTGADTKMLTGYGSFYLVTVATKAGTELLRMDPSESGFAPGLIPDQSTWVGSDGRTYKVEGAFMSFVAD